MYICVLCISQNEWKELGILRINKYKESSSKWSWLKRMLRCIVRTAIGTVTMAKN